MCLAIITEQMQLCQPLFVLQPAMAQAATSGGSILMHTIIYRVFPLLLGFSVHKVLSTQAYSVLSSKLQNRDHEFR